SICRTLKKFLNKLQNCCTCRMTQGIEKIPDSLGYLVLNDDGAVISSGGDLDNAEKLADTIMNLVQTAGKIPTGEKPNTAFKRLSVLWEEFMYIITVSNHRVYISKRQNISQEPAIA
ncbi:unnamed protein product, partial [Owenia fusiformis]